MQNFKFIHGYSFKIRFQLHYEILNNNIFENKCQKKELEDFCRLK